MEFSSYSQPFSQRLNGPAACKLCAAASALSNCKTAAEETARACDAQTAQIILEQLYE